MKNVLTNYRYYVIESLFTLWVLSALVASGEPASGMKATCWILIVIAALAVSAASFGAMAILIRLWRDELPELTKIVKDE